MLDTIRSVTDGEQIPYVRCKVRKSEEANIRLYKKLGFHISKEEVMTNQFRFVMETLTMEKRLYRGK